jgi:hypothetical protein
MLCGVRISRSGSTAIAVVGRERLLREGIHRGAGDPALVERASHRLLVTTSPRAVLTRSAVDFMRRSSFSPTMARSRR